MARADSISVAMQKLESRRLLSAALPHADTASIAYDSSGVLHAAFYDSVAMDLKYATRAANGVWSAVVTLDAGAGTGTNLSLALDSRGLPGVAYYDAAHKALKYARFNGSKWSVATIDAEGKIGRNPSLAFDTSDHPLISYYSTSNMDLRLAAFSGRRWSVQTIDAGGNVGRFSSIAIDPTDGTWAIAYESATDRQIRIAVRRRKTFSVGVIDTLSDAANWASKPSLAFDAGNRAEISYADPANDTVVLSRLSGKHWRPSVAASGPGVGFDNELSFDSRNGLARMVFLSQAGEVNLAAFDGSAWNVTDLGVGTSAAAAQDPLTHALTYIGNQTAADIFPELAAPTGVTTSISMDNPLWMNVHWTDNSTGENDFRIQRSTDGVNFSTVDIVPANTNDYDDAEIQLDTTYYYRIVPFDASGDGSASTIASGTSWVANPTSLHALVVNSGEIDLSWTNVSTTATHLEIHGVDDSDSHNILDVALNLDPGTTSYHVTQLADGTPLVAGKSYAFWIRAVRSDTYNESASSTGTTAFAAPVDFYIDTVTQNQMHMTWSDVLDEDGYELQWSTDNSNFTTLATLGADVTDYSLNGLAQNTTYYFRVRALSGSGNSAFSQVSSSPTQLATPTNVVATPQAGGQIQLTWDDNASGEDSYDVEVAGPSGVWTLPIVLPAGTTTYTATQGPFGALEPSLQYRFSVRALVGQGGASNRGISNIVTALA